MIENKKFIEQLEDSNLDLNTVEEYKSSLDKINNFIALIKNSEFSKEYIEQLSIETKQIESYIDQIKNNTSLARQRISNIKNHANRIKNITLEVVLRNPNLNNLLTNIIKKDDAMKTVETTKKAAEEQISLLNQALESTRDAIEDMNS